jgi:hypothetical protein
VPRRAPADHHALAAERLSRLDDQYQATARRSRRRGLLVGTTVLVLVMASAVVDGLGIVDSVGVDSATVTAVADGTTLSVRYPDVTRPALASPFEIVVSRPGGFEGQSIEVAVSTDYLLLWDLNGVIPSPSAETAGAAMVVWTFDPPSGDQLRIVYEARIEPAVQNGEQGRVAVLDERGDEQVAVEFETQVRP